MFGAWPTGELPWSTGSALEAGSSGWPAIENWLTALNSSCLCRSGCRSRSRGHRRRLVHRARTSLWHHHTSRGGSRWCWCGLGFLNSALLRWRRCGDSFPGGRSGCDWRSRSNLNGSRCLSSRCGCLRSRGADHLRLLRNRHSRRRRSCCRCRGFRSSGMLGWLGSYCRRRFNHHGGRNDGDNRTRRRSARRRLGHHCSSRRLRGNRRCLGRNNGRSRARLGHNLARFRLRRRSRCGWGARFRSCRLRRSFWRYRSRFAWGHKAPASLGFLFLLFGEDCLHHVAGLRHVREIDFWSNDLRNPRSTTGVACPCSMLEMRAYLLGFVLFNRARVSLALTHAKFHENVENLATLDFQLAREIVNSNLAHPPLFRLCCPKPLVAPGSPTTGLRRWGGHGYLLALAC